uniref:G-protein coupled receptors family 1 profile domain-containing protein n=1 Tax=Plectus sambesii TaxID=2011161 RepID=A0A914WFE5_9BILA
MQMTAQNISCESVQTKFPDLMDHILVKTLIGTLYAIVMVLGVVGNILTAHCVLRLRVNVGINPSFALSFVGSNLMIALLSLPFTAQQTFTRVWLLGSVLCKIVPFLTMSGTFVCSFTLAAIAVDRYRNVTNMQQIVSSKEIHFDGPHALITIGLWLLAFCLSFPHSFFLLKIVRYDGLCGDFCEECFPSHQFEIWISSTIFVIQFLLPLIILAFCYDRLRKMFIRSAARRQQYALTTSTQKKLMRTKRRTNLLTFLLFSAFALPWLPYIIVHSLRDFELVADSAQMTLFTVAHLIAMTSIMWNPIIYCGLNQDFRRCLLNCVNKELTEIDRSSYAEGRMRVFSQVIYSDGHFEVL